MATPLIALRLSPEDREIVEKWREKHGSKNLSEAVREMIRRPEKDASAPKAARTPESWVQMTKKYLKSTTGAAAWADVTLLEGLKKHWGE